MTLFTIRLVHGLGLVGALCCGLAQAASIEDAIKLRADTFACGGNHVLRVADNEQLRSSVYVIKNPNPEVAFALDRVRVFDAYAKLLFDFPNDQLPANVELEPGFHAGIIAAQLPAGVRSTRPERLGFVDRAISSASVVPAGSPRATAQDLLASAGRVSAWH